MSLTDALNSALTGLQVSTLATQVISGNISNAQTPGYTDESLDLAAINSGTSLGGVQVTGYTSASDTVLSATLNNATSSASYLSTQNSYMTQIQSILDSSNDPPALESAVSNFQSAWTEFSASSNSSINQQAVVSAGQQLATTINSTASQVAALQTQIQSNLSTTVTSLNTDLTQVQNINAQITTALANGQPTGNLEDQRATLVNSISAITTVQILQRPNGEIALYTPGGTALLDGQPQTFSVSGTNVVNSVGADVSGVLTGGSLQADTDFLSTSTSSANGVGVISKINSQLQNFANLFVSTATSPSSSFASTYDSATTNNGELMSGFFTATTDSDGLPDLSSFSVNASLVNGTASVKQASATAVSNTFSATNLAIASSTNTTSSTFTANGLTVNSQNYAGIATQILSGFQSSAHAISTASTSATTQQTYYQNALSSETGVNTDTELVNLTNWQNAYAASAHVISTVQSMFTTLEAMVS